MNTELSALAVLELIKQRQVAQTLRHCSGKEMLYLIKMIRVADIHAEFSSQEFPGYGRLPSERARNILHGIDILMPQLLAKVDGDDLEVSEVLDTGLLDWVTQQLDDVGTIAGLERLASLEKSGLTKCVLKSENDIVIELLVPDLEAIEHAARNEVLDYDKSDTRAEFRRNVQLYVEWNEEWRANGSAQVSQESFRRLISIGRKFAELHRNEFAEANEFDAESRIGPLKFGHWIEIAEVIYAEGFARSHLQNNDLIRSGQFHPAGYLQQPPVSISHAELISFISATLLTADQALYEAVKSCTTLQESDFSTFGVHLTPSNAPLIESGNTIILPRYVRTSNPYSFLLSRLMFFYEDDLTRARDEREAPFQCDLLRLFAGEGYIVGKLNAMLNNEDGTDLTDIDSAIYEKKTNCLYLFQLYWPDIYAGEPRKRENRYKNFRKKTKWITDVQGWIKDNATSELIYRLDLNDVIIDVENLQVELIMLNRWWTMFSGKSPYKKEAIWLSWSYLRFLVKQAPDTNCLLAFAYTAAKRGLEIQDLSRPFEKDYQVGSMHVLVKRS
jgi:hypothetical protein